MSDDYLRSIKAKELIQKAKDQGRKVLTEAESKSLAGLFGVPVVEEVIVITETEASVQAQRMGYPVVLKGLGANLTHKTERGLVRLGLNSDEQVRDAFFGIRHSAGADWEGCLVQPQIEGKREFAAGLFRDPQFGPAVMLALGGIFTEALDDVTFRIAPLSREGAAEMLDALSCRKMLSAYRGETAADRKALINTLMGLSELALAHPEISEVDINPLIISPNGRVTAVDALVVLEKEQTDPSDAWDLSVENKKREEEVHKAIHAMIHPGSIAVLGAKRSHGDDGSDLGDIFHRVSNYGFPGRLYPVNPNVDEIRGYKSYPDLASLPETPDLVIVCLPAKLVPDALRSCVSNGCKNVHIFSSGFKETGERSGIALQTEIAKIVREGGLHVIGPNCMGFHVPSSGITTMPNPPKESGPVGFISQSGGNVRDFNTCLHQRFGLNPSKMISYGNALALDCTDFLSYLAGDDETKVITIYLEGVKDGRKLFQLVRETFPVKPVVMLKAGLTESGGRAVASHTGSMAGDEKIWKAFFAQSGAVTVDSLEEMAEAALALLYLKKCQGRNAAIVGAGGGLTVAAADACARTGLFLPQFSGELVAKLREFIPEAGNMVRNPIDAHLMFFNLEMLGRILDLVSEDASVDMVIISLQLDWIYTASGHQAAYLENIARYLAEKRKGYIYDKPMVVAYKQYEDRPDVLRHAATMRDILLKSGIPCYDGLSRAFSALSKLSRYSEFCRKRG